MEMYDAYAAPLAIDASRRSLVEAHVDGAKVTHLVTVSCSGFSAPGVDLAIIRELQLAFGYIANAHRLYGLSWCLKWSAGGQGIRRKHARACVLLCAVELCTLHHQYRWQPDQIVANSLFADGAAADGCASGQRRISTDDAWHLIDLRSTVIPDSAHLMHWRIEDHGFQMSLSPQVPTLIDHTLRAWLTQWLGEHQFGHRRYRVLGHSPWWAADRRSVCSSSGFQRRLHGRFSRGVGRVREYVVADRAVHS